MAKLFAIIAREYLERVRTRWFLISTLFGPLFFLGMIVLSSTLTLRRVTEPRLDHLHIIDATRIGLGQRVAELLAPPRAPELSSPPGVPDAIPVPMPPSPVMVETVAPAQLAHLESEAVRLMADRTTDSYLVLDSLTVRTAVARYVRRDDGTASPTEETALRNALRQALITTRLRDAGIDPARIDALTHVDVHLTLERPTPRAAADTTGPARVFFGFALAFLLYMMILLYGQNVLRSVLEEKTTRVAEVVLSSVKSNVLLAGKVMGVGAVGLTQQAIWLTTVVIFFANRVWIAERLGIPDTRALTIPALPIALGAVFLLFFLLGYLLYSSLFAAVGAMAGSQEDAQQAAQPLMLMLVASMILVQPILLNPSGTLAVGMSLFPFTAPIIMPLRMSATDVPIAEVIASLVAVALACWGAIWISARIYRVGLLMTGKRPGLRELARWIRHG